MHRRLGASSIMLFVAIALTSFGSLGLARAAPAGAGWTIQPSPNPAGAPLSSLLSVSCSDDGTCMAVGSYSPPGGGIAPLAEYFDGTSWTVQIPVSPGGTTAFLSSVSCPTPKLCMAVGYVVSGSTVKPLVEESDTATWKILPTPQPPDSFWAILTSVSSTDQDCIAVGGFIKNGPDSQEQPLSEQWRGGTWSLVSTLNPHSENGSGLDAVTCVRFEHCEAVGSYVFADVVENVFAFGWNGTKWAFQPQVNPTGEEVNEDRAVACMGSSGCTSVGTWVDNQGRIRALAEGWDTTSWALQQPGDPQGFQFEQLEGVSCVSPDCEAVGNWSTSLSGFPSSTLAEQWNGSAWAIQPTPNPPGATQSLLEAVQCRTTTDCVAVGNWYAGGVTQTLVETYTG